MWSCINFKFCYFQLKTEVILNKDIIFLETRFMPNTERMLHQHLWIKHCDGRQKLFFFLKVHLNTWILKASPAENIPGYLQPLSSEDVGLEAFQHFVCLTGNFYSPPVYFSFQLMPGMSQQQALPWLQQLVQAMDSWGVASWGWGVSLYFPFPCSSWSMTAVIMASKRWQQMLK